MPSGRQPRALRADTLGSAKVERDLIVEHETPGHRDARPERYLHAVDVLDADGQRHVGPQSLRVAHDQVVIPEGRRAVDERHLGQRKTSRDAISL